MEQDKTLEGRVDKGSNKNYGTVGVKYKSWKGKRFSVTKKKAGRVEITSRAG